MADPLPDGIAAIRVYVEGADGLHGRPYLPDHAIDVLQDACQERQRLTDVAGLTREGDDRQAIGDFVDWIVDSAEAAADGELTAAQLVGNDQAAAWEAVRAQLLHVSAAAMAAVEAFDRRSGRARPDEPIGAGGS
ncbi:hypothetical protein [Inquilinus sp. CA228]|uniref:hypothetical protein n=1 Tax=Inquilinus sp. CA228 TaxID=3455609 RepID=UPI003F8D62A6